MTTSFSTADPHQDVNHEQLEPWTANPRYWQHRGKPVLLLGGSDTDDFFQFSEAKLQEQIEKFQRAGANFIRNTMSDRKQSRFHQAHSDSEAVYAFKEVSPGIYDLNQWNDAYWQRFERMLELTARNAIFVQIELWDGWDIQDWDTSSDPHGCLRWFHHPFNPRNNTNYSESETTLPSAFHGGISRGSVHPFHQTVPTLANDPIALSYQERFIEQILAHTLRFDHVLYQIQNENWCPIEWSLHWARFAHRKAADAQRTIFVCESPFKLEPWQEGVINPQYPGVEPTVRFPEAFTFGELSQSAISVGEEHMAVIRLAWEKTQDRPLPLNSTKQYGADSGDTWKAPTSEGIDRFFRSVFGGQAAVRFHRPPSGLGSGEEALKAIESMRMVERHIDLFRGVRPHSDVCIRSLLYDREENGSYIMAAPGRAYAVYFPNGGHVCLDLSATYSALNLCWLNVSTATVSRQELVSGNSVTLSAPDRGKWVAMLVATAAPSVSAQASSGGVGQPVPGTCHCIRLNDSVGLQMIWAPPGMFGIGDARSTQITFQHGFWLGQTPVTQAQWSAVMEENPSRHKGPLFPVEQISWNEAMEFCRRLTTMARQTGSLPEGFAFTLPSEAQWEYAARAGTTGPWSFDKDVENIANFAWVRENSAGEPHPVGEKKPNPWGFHDMHGNIWEWTRSWNGPYPNGTHCDYEGPPTGTARIARGGSWDHPAYQSRSAARNPHLPASTRAYYVGFRLALST